MPITYKCERCGKTKSVPPSVYGRSERHFCSRKCRMKQLNEELNPERMTPEVRDKISKARSQDTVKHYKKRNGRHEHRTAAEKKLGRKLRKGEIVHHIDRDKNNNDPDNLMIFKNQSDHIKWHNAHDPNWGNKKRGEAL